MKEQAQPSKIGQDPHVLLDQLTPAQQALVTQLMNELLQHPTNTPKVEGAQHSLNVGEWKGFINYMAPDFDEPLEDFRPYME